MWWAMARPRPVPFFFGREKRIEDSRQIFWRDSGALVHDIHDRLVRLDVFANHNALSRRCGLDGIQDDVQEDLLDLKRIDGDVKRYQCPAAEAPESRGRAQLRRAAA